jgi:YidC/Oxa1 family membrane protein insertase
MERRVFIAVLLSFVVLYTYQTYFAPPPPKSPVAGVKPAAAPSAATSTAPAAPASVAGPAPGEPAPVSLLGETQAREITVDTATVRAVFTNRGARILHWQLKNYRDTQGALVDLVPSGLPEDEARPFTLVLDDSKETARANTALYGVTGESGGVVDVASGQPLVFEFQDENGLGVRKEFRFERNGYTFTATVARAAGYHDAQPRDRLGTRPR